MSSQHLERKLKEALGDDAGAEQAAVNDRIDSIREFRDEVRADIAELRHELRAMEMRLEQRIDKATIRLIMWSAGFWVAAVGAIAALAGVLRR